MGADDSRGQSIQASLHLQRNGAVPLREGQLLGKRKLVRAENSSLTERDSAAFPRLDVNKYYGDPPETNKKTVLGASETFPHTRCQGESQRPGTTGLTGNMCVCSG